MTNFDKALTIQSELGEYSKTKSPIADLIGSAVFNMMDMVESEGYPESILEDEVEVLRHIAFQLDSEGFDISEFHKLANQLKL